ncbi:MAG: YihY/virulence factor BrkB family protein [Candidatus Binataceae bacterium]|nr:YihY/virulence factor BrkB family protein [Candidatus Binataceae bacterium]
MKNDDDVAAHNGQGQHAETPSEIPKHGWINIIKRVYASMNQKNLSVIAAGVAFYGMLSIFPALVVLVALYGFLADPATVQHEINAIHGIVPGEAQNIISKYLESLVHSSNSKLGFSLILGLLIALWSARNAAVSLIEALNITYEESEKRNFLRFQAVAMGMTIAAILFAVLALVLIAAVPAALAFLPFSAELKIVASLMRWPLLIAIVVVSLSAIYRFAPSRREAKWRWVTWGSVFATALWVAGSIAFSFYVSKFGSYDKTFGSLGAVVVLLTWFYLSAYVVLLGGSLNAEMERQTARDTTHGPEKPMGRRGAMMADTVAQPQA